MGRMEDGGGSSSDRRLRAHNSGKVSMSSILDSVTKEDPSVKYELLHELGFALNGGPITTLSNSVLFPKGHPFPSVKMLSLQRSNTFQLEAFYSNQNELPPGISTKISDFLAVHPTDFDL